MILYDTAIITRFDMILVDDYKNILHDPVTRGGGCFGNYQRVFLKLFLVFLFSSLFFCFSWDVLLTHISKSSYHELKSSKVTIVLRIEIRFQRMIFHALTIIIHFQTQTEKNNDVKHKYTIDNFKGQNNLLSIILHSFFYYCGPSKIFILYFRKAKHYIKKCLLPRHPPYHHLYH